MSKLVEHLTGHAPDHWHWSDSAASVAFCQRQGLQRTRHIEVCYLWLQSLCNQKRLRMRKIKGDLNPMDIATKPLAGPRLRFLAGLCNLVDRRSGEEVGGRERETKELKSWTLEQKLMRVLMLSMLDKRWSVLSLRCCLKTNPSGGFGISKVLVTFSGRDRPSSVSPEVEVPSEAEDDEGDSATSTGP